MYREQIKALFQITNAKEARAEMKLVLERFSEDKRYAKSCAILEEGFEDAFQYAIVGKGQARIRSINLLERLNEEIRRREKVVRIFPNTASATRLIGAILMDIHECWISKHKVVPKELNSPHCAS